MSGKGTHASPHLLISSHFTFGEYSSVTRKVEQVYQSYNVTLSLSLVLVVSGVW